MESIDKLPTTFTFLEIKTTFAYLVWRYANRQVCEMFIDILTNTATICYFVRYFFFKYHLSKPEDRMKRHMQCRRKRTNALIEHALERIEATLFIIIELQVNSSQA